MTDGGSPASDRWERASSMLRRPLVALVALFLCYAVLSLLTHPNGHLGADTGAKVYTLEVMDQQDSVEPDIGYWAEDEDPSGELHPVHHTRRQPDGSWVAVTTLPMLEAGAPLYRWGGYRATLILPMVAGVLAAFAARALARRFDPAGDGWSAFWVVGLASPVAIYALDFWEHTAGVACTVGAVAVLLGILDERPAWTAVFAGALLGSGAVMRNEVLVYALVAVGVTGLALLVRRRLVDAIVVGVTTIAGFAIPWFANVWLESAVEGQSRASRATGTASRVDPTSGSSLRLGERIEEGLQTSVGLVSGDAALSVLLGCGVLAAIVVAMRAEKRGDRTFAVAALCAAGAVYIADAIGGLGFIPGMLVAFPVAVAGFLLSDRTSIERFGFVIAVAALPVVYLFQFLGGAGPQWGGRYTLGSGIILGVLGLNGLFRRFPVVGRGLLGLSIGVTMLGIVWVSVRTHEVASFFDDLQGSSAPVVIARQAFLLREGGASIVGERWLSVENEDEFTDAVEVARTVGEEQFTVLEWDGEAPPADALPDDVVEVDRRMLEFVDTPVGLVTYEFIG